jgi:hypothetical protein
VSYLAIEGLSGLFRGNVSMLLLYNHSRCTQAWQMAIDIHYGDERVQCWLWLPSKRHLVMKNSYCGESPHEAVKMKYVIHVVLWGEGWNEIRGKSI